MGGLVNSTIECLVAFLLPFEPLLFRAGHEYSRRMRITSNLTTLHSSSPTAVLRHRAVLKLCQDVILSL